MTIQSAVPQQSSELPIAFYARLVSFEAHSTCFLFYLNIFFIVHHYGTDSERLLNTAELIETELLARIEASTLPKFITPCMA